LEIEYIDFRGVKDKVGIEMAKRDLSEYLENWSNVRLEI